ncbi:MAG: sulfite exporter TauE/SafE family protein [Gammaproteobacteria bacterium]|nr:sulfite exporter TauE/SafE family protein [Gammaproteobacteria bacterium]
MSETLTYSAAFVLGLFGSLHCVGMCGGIVSAFSFSLKQMHTGPRVRLLLAYNGGRLLSYSLIGALLGSMTWLAHNQLQEISYYLRLFAGAMLVAMGLYLARWWLGLAHLEQAGQRIWKFIQPLGKKFLPVSNPAQALLLGTLWGWLPCGLVYSVTVWAAASMHAYQAALIMFCFGLGTLPAMLLTGHFAEQLRSFSQSQRNKRIAALLIISFGLWTLTSAVLGNRPGTDHQHHLQPVAAPPAAHGDHSMHSH